MSVRIRRLTEADIDLVSAMLATAYGRAGGWQDDLARFLALPASRWFAAELDGRLAGMGGATDYGPFAWIGLMAVDPPLQKRGIGRAILEAILAWIHERGCPTAVLDASAAGERLYEHYGFVDHGTTMLFERQGGLERPLPTDRVTQFQPGELDELVQFDGRFFGAARRAVLASLLRDERMRGLVTRDDAGGICGYLVAQPSRLGPWVAATPEAAEALLAAALALCGGASLSVRPPSFNRVAEPLLTQYAFRYQRASRHMYLGPSAPPQDRSQLYSEASFAIW